MKYVIFSVLFLSIVACGVKNRQVNNQPPVMDVQANIVSHYGSLVPDSITVFFWPAEWAKNDQEAQQKTALVKASSVALEKSSVARAFASGQRDLMWAAFVKECVPTFAKSDVAIRADEEVPMKTMEDLSSEAERTAYNKCVELQKGRLKLAALVKDIEAKQPQLMGTMLKTIDPTYPKQVNWKSVSASNPRASSFVVSQTAVDITLVDFMKEGHTVSTKSPTAPIINAKYDEKTRTLTFTIPDTLGPIHEGKPVTAYHFILTRLDDLVDPSGKIFVNPATGAATAKFSGDIYLIDAEKKPMRQGTAQFVGSFR